MVQSQLCGGMIWGVSFALHEQAVMDPRSGRPMNPNLGEYHIPVNADVPSVQAILVEERDPLNKRASRALSTSSQPLLERHGNAVERGVAIYEVDALLGDLDVIPGTSAVAFPLMVEIGGNPPVGAPPEGSPNPAHRLGNW
jgi:hypothetical protein